MRARPRHLALAAMVTLVAGAIVSTPAARDWLTRPWSGATDHTIAQWAAWHGRSMVVSWAILIPLGTLCARYCKVWPGQDWPARLDDKRWWRGHVLLQSAGIVLATGGLWLAWNHARGATDLARWHAVGGWAIMLLGWSQIAGGILRGSKGGPTDTRAAAPGYHGDHYAMTLRRRCFERVHKASGYGAIGLSLGVVPAGLILADAPRWMWLVIGGWWALLAAVAWRWQRAGRCIDTYQAIWGPAADLPGNRRRPIGWGVSRSDPFELGGVRKW